MPTIDRNCFGKMRPNALPHLLTHEKLRVANYSRYGISSHHLVQSEVISNAL